jgi:stage V sporulation protein G
VAHPINSSCRDLIQESVLRAYDEELVLAQQPGYICRYDDYGEDSYAESDWDTVPEESPAIVPIRTEAAESQHRIEPAAESPPAPHHGQNGPSLPKEIAGRIPRSADREDDFGDGII